MLLRLLVLLMLLCVGIGVVEASGVQPSVEIEVPALGIVGEVEDASDAAIGTITAPRADDDRPVAPSPTIRDPLRYQHPLSVFRPPRAAAFD